MIRGARAKSANLPLEGHVSLPALPRAASTTGVRDTFAAQAPPNKFVRVLQVNDVHGRYDMLAYIATLVERIRRTDEYVVVDPQYSLLPAEFGDLRYADDNDDRRYRFATIKSSSEGEAIRDSGHSRPMVPSLSTRHAFRYNRLQRHASSAHSASYSPG